MDGKKLTENITSHFFHIYYYIITILSENCMQGDMDCKCLFWINYLLNLGQWDKFRNDKAGKLTNPKNTALATASFFASLKTSCTLSAYLVEINIIIDII